MAPVRPATLAEVQAEVWRQLQRAPRDKHHAWRTPVLATVDGDGADARTVVLREIDVDRQQLVVFTDRRAAKVAQLVSHPNGTLVMWSATLGWQLRCRVRLTVQSQGLAATSRWALVKLSPAAQDYLSPLPPGAALADAELPGDSPGALSADAAREPAPQPHFAIIEAQVLAIDWLELKRGGHRRALFDDAGARWVQP